MCSVFWHHFELQNTWWVTLVSDEVSPIGGRMVLKCNLKNPKAGEMPHQNRSIQFEVVWCKLQPSNWRFYSSADKSDGWSFKALGGEDTPPPPPPPLDLGSSLYNHGEFFHVSSPHCHQHTAANLMGHATQLLMLVNDWTCCCKSSEGESTSKHTKKAVVT